MHPAVLSAMISIIFQCLSVGKHLKIATCRKAALHLCINKVVYIYTFPFFSQKLVFYSCCSMHFEHVLFCKSKARLKRKLNKIHLATLQISTIYLAHSSPNRVIVWQRAA
jgi:hypothetical protein